jgi:peptidoglycan L-alanyl-D-glutamate endopeptidase CwlK
MDLRSEAQLATVMPSLAVKVRAAAAVLEVAGTHLLVVSGLRTAAQQDALYAQGRNQPGHVVTNARAGQSMHNYGLAVDVVPYLSGGGGALNWTVSTPQFQAMVAAMKAQGLAWGGDWKGNLADYDHFQMSGLPASPSSAMEIDYAAVSGARLDAIWSKVQQGNYQSAGAPAGAVDA